MMKLLSFFAATVIGLASAYNNECNDNIVDYWGQNSYGAANSGDPAGWQKSLGAYCDDDTIDVLPIAFLTTFFSTGNAPIINLANICNAVDNSTFPGTGLANCQGLAPEIKACQAKGKIVTLSLGGASSGVGFQSDSQASTFADTLWNLFLGGSSSTRPFGDAVLDGLDLDIESGGGSYYPTFLKQLKSHFDSSSKSYYITAAPQCVYPDANLQTTLNAYPFDAVYVQFYNNPCGLQYFNTSSWNFGVWDVWARTISPNKDVKVYIGAPASSSAAGSGYVSAATLLSDAISTRNNFPSFGGVMFWDASQAYENGQIDKYIKNGLSSGASCSGSFSYPACSAPAYVSGNTYTQGQTVSYNGYIWSANFWTTGAPSATSDWNPISACSGSSGSTTSKKTTTTAATTTTQVSTTTTASTTTSVTKTTTTTSSATATSTGGSSSCSGASAWSSSTAYTTGSTVTYNGSLWKNQWWSQNDTPGGSSGVWINQGSCSSASKRSVQEPIHASADCEGNDNWNKAKVYRTGSTVAYNGAVYTAVSINMRQNPETSDAWALNQSC